MRNASLTQSVPTCHPFSNISSHCPATLSLFRHSLLQPPHWDLEKGVFCLLPAPTVFTNSYGQQLPIFHGATPLTSEQCVGPPLATAAQLCNVKALPSLVWPTPPPSPACFQNGVTLCIWLWLCEPVCVLLVIIVVQLLGRRPRWHP